MHFLWPSHAEIHSHVIWSFYVTQSRKLRNWRKMVWYQGRHITGQISCIICDAPAKAFVKSIKQFSGYYGCDKCIQKGQWLGHMTSAGGQSTAAYWQVFQTKAAGEHIMTEHVDRKQDSSFFTFYTQIMDIVQPYENYECGWQIRESCNPNLCQYVKNYRNQEWLKPINYYSGLIPGNQLCQISVTLSFNNLINVF